MSEVLSMRQEFLEAEEAAEIQPVAVRPEFPADVLAKFELTEAELKDMAARALPMKINGAVDKQGFALAHATRIELRDARLMLDKTRKTNNEDAQKWIKMSNAVAKYLISLIEPAEEHLDAEEAAYNAEVNRVKAEAQRIADERNQGRLNALMAVGAEISLAQVVLMDDATFQSYLALATKAHEDAKAKAAAEAAEAEAKARAEAEEKAKKEAEEAAAREAERQALAAQREENAKVAAALKAQQDAIDKQKAEIDLAARVKAEADKAIQEAKERQEKADREAEAKAQAEAARLAAIEAAKPDAEKLHAFADKLMGMIPPEMATEAGARARAEIVQAGSNLIALIRTKASALTK